MKIILCDWFYYSELCPEVSTYDYVKKLEGLKSLGYDLKYEKRFWVGTNPNYSVIYDRRYYVEFDNEAAACLFKLQIYDEYKR